MTAPSVAAFTRERLHQLGTEDPSDPEAPRRLLDRHRPPADPGPDRRAAGRVDRAARQPVPTDQHEPEVDRDPVVDGGAGVVQAVVGRAHQDPSERSEGPAQVGVRERHQAAVDDQGGGRERSRWPRGPAPGSSAGR